MDVVMCPIVTETWKNKNETRLWLMRVYEPGQVDQPMISNFVYE